jgi:hypothetical protein
MNSEVWRKSSRSSAENACVELSVRADHEAVRDSKNPGGPTLIVDVTKLIDAVKFGQIYH